MATASPLRSNQSKTVGLFLKTKRLEKGLTQSDVAHKLGYGSPQFISNIERGISSIPLKSLRAFVDLYSASPVEVLEILLADKRQYLSEQLGLIPPSTEANNSTASLEDDEMETEVPEKVPMQ